MDILIRRVVWGKIAGLILSLLFIGSQYLMDKTIGWLSVSLLISLGFWGMLIGFCGQINRHPIFGFRMPWWFRGGVIGSFFGFMLYGFSPVYWVDYIGSFGGGVFSSVASCAPVLFAIEMAFWGAVIDGLMTRYIGDGPVVTKS